MDSGVKIIGPSSTNSTRMRHVATNKYCHVKDGKLIFKNLQEDQTAVLQAVSHAGEECSPLFKSEKKVMVYSFVIGDEYICNVDEVKDKVDGPTTCGVELRSKQSLPIDVRRSALRTETDPIYFYGYRSEDRMRFESTRHRDHYLAVAATGTLTLKRSVAPCDDGEKDDIHFILCTPASQ